MTNTVDCSGNVVASYAYDTWDTLTSASESFANGWTNPYRYDGRDGVRYDASDGLYWMSVRAYDPTIGRFISHDPLGRAPLFFSDQPYAYAGNNPVSNVDPSGQYRAAGSHSGEGTKHTSQYFAKNERIAHHRGCDKACHAQRRLAAQMEAQSIAGTAAKFFHTIASRFVGASIGMGILAAGFALTGVLVPALAELMAQLALVATAIAGAFVELNVMASDIAGDFAREANNSDAWYTRSNLSAFGNSLQGDLSTDFFDLGIDPTVFSLSGAAGLAIAACIIKSIATSGRLLLAAKLVTWAWIAYAVVLLVGYAFIQAEMESYARQQEQDVLS